MISFRANDVFGATVFSSYGMFWMALGFLFFFAERMGIATESLPTALGITLLAWTIFTVYAWVASIKGGVLLFVTFTVLVVLFIVLTIGFWTSNTGLIALGGYLGIINALLAFYLSAAGLINAMFDRGVLPVK